MTPQKMAFLAGAAYVATFLAVASIPGLAFGITAQLVFVLPGVLLLRAIAGVEQGWLTPLAFGPLVGQVLSSLALLGLWAVGGRGAWTLLAAPALTGLLVRPARRLAGRWQLPATDARDAAALLALLVLVPLIVAWPFAHVGFVNGAGQHYRAYFTADYVWRRAVVIELAKGDFLPVNPFYANDALHYYWLPHLMSAVQYRAAGAMVTLDQLLLIRSVCIDAFFVACLYGATRMFGIRPWAAACAVAATIVCSSFEGAYAVLDHYAKGIPLRALTSLNIDAVSRWYFQGMPIDGLQRVLFYQPHHAAGYAAGLLGVLAVSQRTRRFDPAALAIGGLLLGLSTLFSSFVGLMFTAVAAVYEGVSVLVQREWRRGAVHAVAAALPLGLAAAAVLLLQYVDRGGSVIRLGVNPQSTRRFLVSTALSLGPMLIVAGWGVLIAFWRRRGDLRVLAALFVTSVFFYFFVDVRDHQDVYVGWRVGHLLLMAAAVPLGLLFERVASWTATGRRVAVAVIGVVLAAAVPTTAIDIYNTQDITNFGQAPTFKWTLLLTTDELEAFNWIKANTPADALFQVDPTPRDSMTWAYLPAFAERRMALGLPISMIPLAKYQEGTERIGRLFELDGRDAYDLAARNGVEYLLIGPPERAAHPGIDGRLDAVPALLRRVFKNGSVTIYQVLPEL